MATRGIDNKGDWLFGYGIACYKTEKEELKQNILTTLRSWFGDCFFDKEAGIDWYNFIGSIGREKDLKNDIIRNISNIEAVININKYDAFLNNKTRKINIVINVNSIYGNIEIAEEV